MSYLHSLALQASSYKLRFGVNEFTRTSIGKVDKKVLRDQFKDLVLP
jgi:non-ribosomal peptide synthetase component E (peptide arylation enzyme)